MPKINKRKKVSNSEDEKSASSSDSGPEDRNPPPKNEATKMATASTGSAKKPDQNPPGEAEPYTMAEPSWQLDKQRVLKVRSWRGKTFIDIREYYEKDGQQLPGKKGISLSASQWSKLKSIIPEVDKALEEI